MSSTLLVYDGNEANACRRKDIHCIHKGRTHNPEHIGHPLGNQCLNKSFRRRHGGHALDNFTIICTLAHIFELHFYPALLPIYRSTNVATAILDAVGYKTKNTIIST